MTKIDPNFDPLTILQSMPTEAVERVIQYLEAVRPAEMPSIEAIGTEHGRLQYAKEIGFQEAITALRNAVANVEEDAANVSDG